MAIITVTNGDSEFDREVIASTLRLISEQPSDWFIGIDYTPEPGDDRRVDGIIAEFDGTTLVIADHDDEAQATGAETTIDLHDITEIEVY